ncbi:General amino acid permease AGP2 [Cladobotryum mycophilum]|uniref:General amino acid permease AGP2 n=1 Tax=Cladobotryum mycophilum TaxID=491253 RepID=A0ABR0SXU7_9HYPO
MGSKYEEKHSKLEIPGSPVIGHSSFTQNVDGTALFVSIGGGLVQGGPASLLLAFTLYSMVLALVNNCVAEMTVLMPVSGGFVRLAGKWVDDALSVAAGYNFFLYEALLIPFEITALNLVISFWDENITKPGPTAGICAAVIICYALLNVLAVKSYGEAEFYLSSGKIILIFMLFTFTFVTMVGGNPQGDAFGFRYWNSPGAFVEYHSKGASGRFEGFLAALWNAAFAIVGPEYISMVAAEAQRPRITIKTAFKTIYFRFGLFFIGSALAVGIIVPSNDKNLVNLNSSGNTGTAAASPYVVAMQNMGISVLPHIVNALMMTSIFSAGNTYTYCATRSLYGLALEGRAPKFLRKCTKNGVPIYCFLVVMCFPLLSFLQVGSGSAVVLSWLVTLITAGGIIDYIVMEVTYICFYRACKAQGIDRRTLPYYGWGQPYCAVIALIVHLLVVIFYGYRSFAPWSVKGFFQSYTMQLVAPTLFIVWKVIKRTKFVRPHEADLIWERPIIDAYEAQFTEPQAGFWTEMLQLVGLRKGKKSDHVEA